ncbi:MAG: LysR family transcriptional regulator [Actinobacteria bacterium]|nr:LysR family transcriptional regulator [Actinomycetota bacterium]
MEPLNLRHLEFFVAAAGSGTMTGGAGNLGVSQSAISLGVSQLEGALGTQLFVRRSSRGLALTEAGARFLPAARDLLAHAEDVAASGTAEGSEVVGRLAVGCFRTAAPFLLPGLLESFRGRFPSIELDFFEGPMPEIDRALRDGRCELALVYDLDIPSDIELEPLYEAIPYALVGADHRLAAADEVDLADLAAEDMMLLDVPPSAEYLLSVFSAAGLEPVIRHRTSSYELVRSLVGRGLGYALLISRPPGDLSYEGRPITALRLSGDPPSIRVCIARLSSVRPTRRAREFATHCRAVLSRPQVGP